MFGYRMEERKDDGFTTLELYGIPDSEENIRFAEEALLEFYYPENVLVCARIECTDSYALTDPMYRFHAQTRRPFPEFFIINMLPEGVSQAAEADESSMERNA